MVDLEQMGRGAAAPGERIAITAACTVALPDVSPDSRSNVAPRRDWWRLWTESRAVCAAAPVETPLGPPSEYTIGADSGAGDTTGEIGIPAPAAEPTAEASAAASADAPGSPPSGNTPGAGSGAGVVTGETASPAAAWQPTAEAPPAAPADAPFSPPSEYTKYRLRRRSGTGKTGKTGKTGSAAPASARHSTVPRAPIAAR